MRAVYLLYGELCKAKEKDFIAGVVEGNSGACINTRAFDVLHYAAPETFVDYDGSLAETMRRGACCGRAGRCGNIAKRCEAAG